MTAGRYVSVKAHATASPEPTTPWAVHCPNDGKVYLSRDEYDLQMGRPDALWRCPACGAEAEWDDANYEASFDDEDDRDALATDLEEGDAP